MGVGKDLWIELETRYNKSDLSGAASLYASDAVCVDPTSRYEGRDAIQAYLEVAQRAFPDARYETSRLIEEGDTVVAEWTFRGTQTGPFATPDGSEIPATGKAVETAGVSVVTVRDGQLASARDYFDNVSMMSQLGLLPGA